MFRRTKGNFADFNFAIELVKNNFVELNIVIWGHNCETKFREIFFSS